MKNKIYLSLFALVASLAIFSAFDKPDSEDYAAGVGGYSPFDYRKDTITDAEIDTLLIGTRQNSNWNTVTRATNMLSLYTYDIKVVRASLSGTHNVKLYLDASNYRSGTATDWFTIDSTSATTATTAIMRSTDATAVQYRLRIKGTGTQSSTYQIWSMWKKKN